MLIFVSRERRGWHFAAQRIGNASELVGWGKLVFQNGWHALTIGKGVRRVNQPNLHALPGGQGRATHVSKIYSVRTSSSPCLSVGAT